MKGRGAFLVDLLFDEPLSASVLLRLQMPLSVRDEASININGERSLASLSSSDFSFFLLSNYSQNGGWMTLAQKRIFVFCEKSEKKNWGRSKR
jgi:hypothetical protein